jgi:predicted heme/steroid binding protein
MRTKTRIGLGLIIFFLFICSLPTAFTQSTFTTSQLSQYDGKGGRPAYVAVRGVVYDVSLAKKLWVNGSHTVCSGCIAGTDITSLWDYAPSTHFSPSFLASFPKVGTLVADTPPPVTPSPMTPPPVMPPPEMPSQNMNPSGMASPGMPTTVTTEPVTTLPVTTINPTPADNTAAPADSIEQPPVKTNFFTRNISASIAWLVFICALVVLLYWGVRGKDRKTPRK